MDTTVNLFELLTAAATVLTIVIGAWISMKIQVQELKTEVRYLKDNEEETKSDIKWIKRSLEEIKILLARGGADLK